MRIHWMGAALLAVALWAPMAVSAQTRKAALEKVESSMVLTGTISIDSAGDVTSMTLDHQEIVPESVLRLVNSSVPGWKFEPVLEDGRAVASTATMRLRVLARRHGEDQVILRLRHAHFDTPGDDGVGITGVKMTPPRYPDAAWKANGQGVVYLALKVGADGRVQEVGVEQVNLMTVGPEAHMRRLRDLFASAASRSAKDWTFAIAANETDLEHTVRVPVNFMLRDGPKDRSKPHWETYIPGPRIAIPWREAQEQPDSFSPDLAGGTKPYIAGHGVPRLLTPLGEG